MTDAPHSTAPVTWRKGAVLATLCVAVFVTVLDGTIVNIALPTLAKDLHASTRGLQWIVDAYLLAFTSLLLAAGGLGDRFGRKRALVSGLVVFGITSALAGAADTTGQLIATRVLMGIGAALIFPATLAIITNVFTEPGERAKAIGVWSAMTGIAVAAGPIIGGWLIERFWWGSIFYVNVPIVAVVLLATVRFVPESRDSHAPRLDLAGLVLSIAAITALVLTIIEAPTWGWASAATIAGFATAAVLLGAFVAWELRTPEPMLPVRIFRNLRFSAASLSIASAFFALFGFVFLIVQYFQLVLGYTPLEAGVRTLPVAFSIAFASIGAPQIVQRVGTTRVVSAGLTLMAAAFAWVAIANDGATPYSVIAGQMVLLGVGLGFTSAPATESIMGSLSLGKAGVGSAVNDTTRELGSTLGVAVLGSVFSSVYVHALGSKPVYSTLAPSLQRTTRESVSAAGTVASHLGQHAPAYLHEVSDAFVSGLHVASLVAAAVAVVGAVFAARFLPARAATAAQEPGLDRPVGLAPEPALAAHDA